jgi:hypothetical protein
MLLPLLMHYMKRYLLLLVLFSFTIPVYCQQITFQKTFGGTGIDYGSAIQQTLDGGYIIGGNTNSFGAGNYDAYLIKTNENGDTLWTKTFGGAGVDYSTSVQQTSDSGYIISGITNSFGAGDYDAYLIKTDANGNSVWSKTFGGTNADYGNSVHQTTDGGYILAGFTAATGAGNYDVYLIKTNANGDSLWTKTFGGTADYRCSSVEQTTDGGYILLGYNKSFSSGDYNIYLIKTDANGDSLWTKNIGGTNADWGHCVQQTSDGGYIIAAHSQSFGAGYADVYLIKTDTDGNPVWSKTFGGTSYDSGHSIRQTSDGGYIIAGVTISCGACDYDIYLIKTDSNGDSLWTKTFGGTNEDWATSVQQTTDGGYIITGHTWNFGADSMDVYLIKTDSNGNSGCNEGTIATIVTTPATQVTSSATIVGSITTIVTTPSTIIGSGGIVTTLCTTVGIPSAIANPKSEIVVSPNPFTSELTVQSSQKIIQIVVYDLMGAIVYQQELTSNQTSATLNLSFLQQGVYFLNVKANGESWTKKIVKM